MLNKNKITPIVTLFLCLILNLNIYASAEGSRYPDYAKEYLGTDKFETFNRKMFAFNSRLNKCVLRPVHVVWSSVMPKYGMDRIQSAYTNIEYPKRLVSTLVQRDFKASGRETVRFLTNSTLGLGGLYDPAKKYFKIDPAQEDMEQALARCKVKSGPYVVLPIASSTTIRGAAGKLLDAAMEPTLYLGMPIVSLAKAALVVNKTAYMQPISKMIESTYADPYDIARKLYGLENYIKTANLDRKDILDTKIKLHEEEHQGGSDDTFVTDDGADVTTSQGANESLSPEDDHRVALNNTAQNDDLFVENVDLDDMPLNIDMMLENYNPQGPITDSMRTALFELPGITDSKWAEFSVWNKCFRNRISTSSVNVDKGREDYKFNYILQKDKSAPVAIIYPSIGEGITSHHSIILAKIFYDEGYSVVIQGSAFHWEFAKSMPKDYKPGMPSRDADYLRLVTSKILNSLEEKHGCKPSEKVLLGTSFGAITTLFLAEKESKDDTLGISKYISINPPIELVYALSALDKTSDEWNKNPGDIKEKTAIIAAKIIQTTQLRDKGEYNLETLPFSEDEAKLITAFILRQKLSDLVFTLEDASKSKKSDIYQTVNNINYRDYVEKYLLAGGNMNIGELNYEASLHSIAHYLMSSNNYKIYHTVDDYFTNPEQLKQLRKYAGNRLVLLSNGSHLGYMYRKEFLNALKRDIARNTKPKEENLAHSR